MTNAGYNPKAKMGSGCPTGKLVVVVVVAMVVAAPTLGLYQAGGLIGRLNSRGSYEAHELV